MSRFWRITCLLLVTMGLNHVNGQCPTAGFTIPTEVCQNENISITNTSVNANHYEWNFCQGGINQTPTGTIHQNLSTVGRPYKSTTQIQANSYFSFYTSESSSTIFRLDHGDSVSRIPTVVDLGNINDDINNPLGIDLIHNGTDWYGFVSRNTTADIVRINFGADITNTTPTTDVISGISELTAINPIRDIKMVNDNGSYKLLAIGGGLNSDLVILDFGSNLNATPTVSAFTVSSSSSMIGIDLINTCEGWYALLVGYVSGIHKIKFGTTISDSPVSQVNIGQTSSSLGIEVVRDRGSYFGLVSSESSNKLHRANFGTSLDNDTPTSDLLGDASVLVNAQAFSITDIGGTSYLSGVNSTNKNYFSIEFPQICNSNLASSTLFEPAGLTFDQQGMYDIYLTAVDGNGKKNTTSQSITITANTAPTIDFSIDDSRCISNTNSFASIDGGGIATYSWDFNNDGMEDSDQASTTYDYSIDGIGDYVPSLSVTNSSGCSNQVSKNISIYNAPSTPDFDPVPGALCTNSSISFTNLTDETGLESIIEYAWDFDGQGNSSDKDPQFSFSSAGNKSVELTASIPGCISSPTSKIIAIADAPLVDFTYSNNCFGQAIQFTDASSGENITTYSWDFDDSSPTNNGQNPTHAYASTGVYQVTLTVSNIGGCQTSLQQSITVSDAPKVSFTFDPAIENLPVTFSAQDLTLSDDQVVSWNWDFDGLGNDNIQNPQFTFDTPGNYTVTLDILTTQGCSESIDQLVNVDEANCPTSGFTMPSEVCQNENISITNTSINADHYEWNFCQGGVNQTPAGMIHQNLSTVGQPYKSTTQIQANSYFSFYTSESSSAIFRLDHGDSVSRIPTVVDLGNINDDINNPLGIDLIHNGTDWFGFVSRNTTADIVRINFGTDITNTTPTTDVISGISELTAINPIRDIKMVNDNGSYKLLAIGGGLNSDLVILDFGSNLNATPTVSAFTVSSSNSMIGIDLINTCEGWYALLVGYVSGIHKIKFGTTISDSPTSQVNIGQTSSSLGIAVVRDRGNYFGLVSSESSNKLYRANFGATLDNDTPTSDLLGDASVLVNTQAFSIIDIGGTSYLSGVNSTNKNYFSLEFPQTCHGNLANSTLSEPSELSFDQQGMYDIYLTAIDENGKENTTSQSITITADTAPSISFTTSNNECVTQPNSFTPVDGGGLTYAWDFDNNGSTDSTDPTPEHTFGSLGQHVIELTVDNTTCTNITRDTVSIYPEPAAPTFFTSGTPHCTGTNISFTNLFDETGYEEAALTYSWNYNNEGSSTDRDGSYTFNTDGTKTITLTASIPGCSTSSAGTDLSLVAGPAVNFTHEDKCLGDVTQFTNLTTGTGITSQTWDFGDLNGATTLSPTHEYQAAGEYNVSLTVDNDQGCSNQLITPITIDDRPDANFNMGVGCEGQTVGFEDQSTVNSANIESHSWDFGGLGSSTQEDPLFIFETQGTYPIKLTVESTFGCTNEATKNLNVQLAPEAAFDIDLGCLDASTQFMDRTVTEAENPINIWYWDINGDIVPNTQNPAEIFDTPGDYTATLTVTPSNLCTSSISHDFTIHELPVANFTVDKTCDNEFTSFTDASTSATTSIVAYNWEFGDEGTGNSNPAAFNFNQAGDYLISFTAIDEIGCEDNYFETITINPSPVAAFEVNTDIGPAPLVINFTNKSESASSYLWKFNDSEKTTSTATNTSFSYGVLGEYNAELISSNDLGCSDTTSIPIVVAEPVLDLELVQISQEVSEGKTNLTLSIKNNGNVIVNGFDIRIDLDNNSSIFESFNETLVRNQIVSYPLNFTFSVANNNIGYACVSLIDHEEAYSDINIVNNEACIDFDQKVIVENSYPNPASSGTSKVRLNMILPTKSPVQIFLLDATGGILYQDVYSDTTTGLNSFFLDVNALEQGMYFIKVVYDNVESTQRFVKM